MSHGKRWSVSWEGPNGLLEAHEPTMSEVEASAPRLGAWYNEAHNRSMMANSVEMSPGDVVDHFKKGSEEGGRNFLLHAQGRLMGDADLRHWDKAAQSAEFAIMIGERNVQGRGYGTHFGHMLHALAFGKLGLLRVYVSIIPNNLGSLRLFEKLGYLADDSPGARAHVDAPDDRTFSLGRAEFMARHAECGYELVFRSVP